MAYANEMICAPIVALANTLNVSSKNQGNGHDILGVHAIATFHAGHWLAESITQEEREVPRPFHGKQRERQGPHKVRRAEAFVPDAEPEQFRVVRLGQDPGGGAGPGSVDSESGSAPLLPIDGSYRI